MKNGATNHNGLRPYTSLNLGTIKLPNIDPRKYMDPNNPKYFFGEQDMSNF